jgi:ankyrin repeat protein
MGDILGYWGTKDQEVSLTLRYLYKMYGFQARTDEHAQKQIMRGINSIRGLSPDLAKDTQENPLIQDFVRSVLPPHPFYAEFGIEHENEQHTAEKYPLDNAEYFCHWGLYSLLKKEIQIQKNPNKIKNFVNKKNEYKRTSLHVAAENGHLEIVKLLLGNNANINSQAGNKKTPLHVAVENGHLEIVKLLLGNNANINSQEDLGYSSLHVAVEKGHLEIVKLLLENNADVNIQAGNKDIAFYLAVRYGHLKIVKILLKHTSKDHMLGALYSAVRYGHLEIVKLLLDNGARDHINEKAKYGECTLLFLALDCHYIAVDDRLEIIKLLLENNADVNIQTIYKKTPLHEAVEKGHLEIVKVLLSHGADTTLQNHHDETALDLAQTDEMKNLFRDHHAQSKSSITIGTTEHKDGY